MKPIKFKGANKGSVLQKERSRFGVFFRNLANAFLGLNNLERIVFFIIALVLLGLIALESLKIYHNNTKLVASAGGDYVEVIAGDAKYLSPVLAKTDAERAASRLIYSSLIKIDANNQIIPDLATSWEVSADGLSYTFRLRKGAVFQKGQPFASDDVAATITSIQDDANKSPFRETWSNIVVETPDAQTAVIKLPKAYGPFIYNCAIGIIDSEDAISGSLSSTYNGTGPYAFSQTIPDASGNISILLKANPSYYVGQPLIANVKFLVAKDQSAADKLAVESPANAYSGVTKVTGLAGFADRTFKSGRNLILFMNLRKEALKSLDVRKKLIAHERLDVPTKLSLLVLNAEPQRSRAESIAAEYGSDKNVEINLRLVTSAEYTDAVKKRDYDLLMYGYDWAYDRDPYLFWHSSQLDKNNFDGYSDKASDIALEDARLLLDPAERNVRYDAFYDKVNTEALAIYYGLEDYPCFTGPTIKGIQLDKHYGRPEDRFNNIGKWYITEKRVRR